MGTVRQKLQNRTLVNGTTPFETTVNNLITSKITGKADTTALNNYATKTSITTVTKMTPTLLNGWANYYANNTHIAQFYKQLDNTLQIVGVVKNATTPAHIGPIFTLPAGYIPKTRQANLVRSSNGIVEVTVQETGNVELTSYIIGASPTFIFLNITVYLL